MKCNIFLVVLDDNDVQPDLLGKAAKMEGVLEVKWTSIAYRSSSMAVTYHIHTVHHVHTYMMTYIHS